MIGAVSVSPFARLTGVGNFCCLRVYFSLKSNVLRKGENRALWTHFKTLEDDQS